MDGADYIIAPLLEMKDIDLNSLKTSPIEYSAYLRDQNGALRTEMVPAKLVLPDSSTELGKLAKSLQGKDIYLITSNFKPTDFYYDGVYLKDSNWKNVGMHIPLTESRSLFLHTGLLKGKMFLVVSSHETFHGFANDAREKGKDGKYYDAVFRASTGNKLPEAAKGYEFILTPEELHTYVKDLLRASFINHHRKTLELIKQMKKDGKTIQLKYSSIIDDEEYLSISKELNQIINSELKMLTIIKEKYAEMLHPSGSAIEEPLQMSLADATGQLSSNWVIHTQGFSYEMRNVPQATLQKIMNDSIEINRLVQSTDPEDQKIVQANNEEINHLTNQYLQKRVQELFDKNLEIQKNLKVVDQLLTQARKQGYFSDRDYLALKDAMAHLGLSVTPTP